MDAISLNNMTRLLEMRVPQNPTRYHTIPRFVLQSLKLQPRSFPFNLPTGPHRPTSGMSRPPALGLGSIRGLKDKRKKDLTAQEPSKNLPPIKEEDKQKKQLSFSQQTVGFYEKVDHIIQVGIETVSQFMCHPWYPQCWLDYLFIHARKVSKRSLPWLHDKLKLANS